MIQRAFLAMDARTATCLYWLDDRSDKGRYALLQAVNELTDYLFVQARQQQLTDDYDRAQRLRQSLNA